MSPTRPTRAAMAEQYAISTRSKAQKINNVSQDMTESVRKIRQKKEKSIKKVKQSSKKESPVKVISARKKTSRRKLNLSKEVESDESIGILKDTHCDMNVEFIKHSIESQSASKNLNSKKMSDEKLQQKKIFVKISPIIVTPKSTSPKLSLTPRRSKKTPKKSPISLGSPKTHSIAVSKLFKSPRKLSLSATDEDSEENLDKSGSDSHAKKSRKNKKVSPNSSSISKKSPSISPKRRNKHKKSDVNLKLLVRRFSKSPKIVLKSPKSKKSKSRKLKLLSSSRLKTPTSLDTTPYLNDTNSSKIRIKRSPLSKGKNLSSIKRRLLNSKLTKTLTASQIKDVLAEPIVLLEKLSPENLKRRSIPMIANKTRLNTSIKVRSPSIKARRNSKVLIPMEKASLDMSINRNSRSKLKNSSIESQISNTNKISPRIKYNTLTQEKDKSSVPLMASTPREEKMTSMNTSLESNISVASVNNTSLNTRLKLRNQSNTQLFNIMDKNANIENVSEPLLLDKEFNDSNQSLFSNVSKRNATYNENNMTEENQETNRDNTYELEQPQTLNLQQMIKKRTSTDADLSLRDANKKTRVRFANISSNRNSARKSINKPNELQSSISHNDNVQNGSNIMNSVRKSKRVETPKLTRRNSLISPFKKSSSKFHGDTPKLLLDRIVTPKMASIEKKSEKKSSVKKVPNFARIHEQMFAKSESLVNAKRRLKTRHLAFTMNKVGSKANVTTKEEKPLPTDTKDGIHNRFGFKLKKAEATHIMLKKQVVYSRQKQQQETRMMLKGVRTNRRFKMQMKSRNLNL